MFVNERERERKKSEWGEEDKNPRFEISHLFYWLCTIIYIIQQFIRLLFCFISQVIWYKDRNS